MAVPKKKQSKTKGRQRRTHYTVLAPTVTNCGHCGEPKRPHHVCPYCGTYRGRQFLKVGE